MHGVVGTAGAPHRGQWLKMSDAKQKALMERLAAIRLDYAVTLPNQLNDIEAIWKKLAEGNRDEEQFQRLYRMVHTISGTARICGLSEVGKSASQTEARLKAVMGKGMGAQNLPIDEISIGFQQLRQVVVTYLRESTETAP